MSNRGVLIVSGDQDAATRMRSILEASVPVHGVARAGAECIEKLGKADAASVAAVVVDCALGDISPLNLVGSLTSDYPGLGVILVLTPIDERLRETAMLAGARAVVDRASIEADLLPATQRVLVSAHRSPAVSQRASEGEVARGRVVAVVGAKGGSGRSTLTAGLATTACLAGLNAAMLDLDVQFGDLAFLMDVRPKKSLIDLARDLETGLDSPTSYAHVLREGLSVYASPPRPEQAEIVAPKISMVLNRLRREHDVIFANTGAFWTLLHAELIDAADVAMFVLPPTAVGVRATVLAKEMCSRLGIAESQLMFVVNRTTPKDAVKPEDARTALAARHLATVPDDVTLARRADAGELINYIEDGSTYSQALRTLLAEAASLVGISVAIPTTAGTDASKRRLFGGR